MIGWNLQEVLGLFGLSVLFFVIALLSMLFYAIASGAILVTAACCHPFSLIVEGTAQI